MVRGQIRQQGELMTGLCTLTVTGWDGDPPVPGRYLKSERGRTAYLIVRVKSTARKPVAALVCERERPDRLPPGAIIHQWYWSRR